MHGPIVVSAGGSGQSFPSQIASSVGGHPILTPRCRCLPDCGNDQSLAKSTTARIGEGSVIQAVPVIYRSTRKPTLPKISVTTILLIVINTLDLDGLTLVVQESREAFPPVWVRFFDQSTKSGSNVQNIRHQQLGSEAAAGATSAPARNRVRFFDSPAPASSNVQNICNQ